MTRKVIPDKTPLGEAAANGNEEEVRRLLEAGVDVGEKDWNHHTALWYAVREGHTEVVKLLLKCGGDVNEEDALGCTLLMNATTWERIDTLTWLLNHTDTDINKKAEFGVTALSTALTKCEINKSIVKLLLDNGADVFGTHSVGYYRQMTALEIAACKGDTEVMVLLIEHGAWKEIESNVHGFCDRFPLTETVVVLDEAVIEAAVEEGKKQTARMQLVNDDRGLCKTTLSLLFKEGAQVASNSDGQHTLITKDGEEKSIDYRLGGEWNAITSLGSKK